MGNNTRKRRYATCLTPLFCEDPETRTRYRAKRRSVAAKLPVEKITLHWAEIERATEPIILERNGQPVAVVVKYADYQWWGVARTQRHLEQVRAHAPTIAAEEAESILESQLTAMAADPEIQNELRAINRAFALTESDGLGKVS